MEFVTVFWPSMTTGPGETVVQTAGETRFVVDCRVKLTALVGHVRMTFDAEATIVSCGAATGKVRLNTVPLPELPPLPAVQYRVFPDRIKPACGKAPSLLI